MFQRTTPQEHGNKDTSRDIISIASDVSLSNKGRAKSASREHERRRSPPLEEKRGRSEDPLKGASPHEVNALPEIE